LGIVYSLIAGASWAFTRKKYGFTILGITLLAGFVLGHTLPIFPQQLRVTFLDVGQGDAIVIETPNHHTYIIDTGNQIHSFKTHRLLFDASKQVIIPYLHSKGIHKISGLILTHADMDHIGGASTLIEKIPIDMIFHNGHLHQQLPTLSAQIQHRHIPTLALKNGDQLHLDQNITLTILNPDPNGNPYDEPNDQSITGILKHEAVSFMLTGDLESERELALANSQANLKVTVLKLGHHGSKTSSTAPFLEKTNPQIGIVSAGRFNTYRHPHPSVINRVHSMGIRIFRTDQQGAIMCKSDGKKLIVSTFIRK
jgi:competence protein ComEC